MKYPPFALRYMGVKTDDKKDFKESAILLSLVDVARQNAGEALHLDHIVLEAISRTNCHAGHLLRKLLKEWEVYQVRKRIEQGLKRRPAPCQDVELHACLSGVRERVTPDYDTVNTGHLLLAALADPNTLCRQHLEVYHIGYETIREYVCQLPAEEDYYDELHALESYVANNPIVTVKRRKTGAPAGQEQKKPFPAKYGTDLVEAARLGRIDNVVGRDEEIARLICILGRKKKNNPILVGEAGVGKSAVVEGLALRIGRGEVPQWLQNKHIFSLDVATLVAGTKYRGQFEERVKELVHALEEHPETILFIDEIHTISGAGGAQGNLDAANILKPALARGEMRCIGATTLDEYRRCIESDAALERRFQRILIDPPTQGQTLDILRGLREAYQAHHAVSYSDAALEACVKLSGRYLPERHFPDKAIDVMDEAGSRVNQAGGSEVGELQIRQTIELMSGIPVSHAGTDCEDDPARMIEQLGRTVIGQPHAVERVTRAIQRSRAGLREPGKPIGVFLFVGPTGVGKTHLARELASLLFPGRDSIVRIDMSEYSEKHNVSRLIGSPPGYVGYGEGGQLTEAVRRKPYSVVLLDEVEKAHPDLFNLMLQLFDEGRLTDSLGRTVDFRNTVIILTSNAGSRGFTGRPAEVGYKAVPASEGERQEERYRRSLEAVFAPEFLNRLDDIVVFNTLTPDDMAAIADRQIHSLIERTNDLGLKMEIPRPVRRQLIEQGYRPECGVRSLKRALLRCIEEPLAEMIVKGEVKSGDTVRLTRRKEGFKLRKAS